jgi:predicted ABC-type sugar transport system permease subunit
MACAGNLLFVQKKTRMGREIFAVGCQFSSQRLQFAGINSTPPSIKAHVISALSWPPSAACCSRLINLPSFDLGDPYATDDSIAATVIGRHPHVPGVGGIGGTIGGASL